MADYAAGLVAALTTVAAVWHARHTGRGGDADLSLFESALAQLNYLATWTLSAGLEPVRRADSAHQSMVPFQAFAAADGWLVIAAPKQHLWEAAGRALGREDLLADRRFADFAGRREHRDALVAELADTLAAAPVATWIERLTSAHVPCAPVNTVAEALSDEQSRVRGIVAEVEHPTLGTVRHVASPLRLDGVLEAGVRRAPRRGEHAAEVLGELCGYDAARIAALREAGAFGQ
jgi:crotonobetainyl-CoA:carnitine CoA-transferase CaiB-like acyl-CoA transferase